VSEAGRLLLRGLSVVSIVLASIWVCVEHLPINGGYVASGEEAAQNWHSTDVLCQDYPSRRQCQLVSVVAYTGGIDVPSARFRIRQHIGALSRQQILIQERYLRWGRKKPRRMSLRPLWIAATVGDRLLSIAAGRYADVALIQRQALPAFLPVEPFIRQPIVHDVDDAIWLNRGGKRAKEVARRSVAVICGNSYLADYFRQWNQNVYIVPTAVDTNGIVPGLRRASARQVIGWIGSSENLRYLYQVETAIREVLACHSEAELMVVSNEAPRFERLSPERVRFVRWSPEAERRAFAEMTIGLMPLEDSEWARGKCSFKMLCYMAAGSPVIVSPVGMNREVLGLGNVGFGATTCDEWISALEALLGDSDLAAQMGASGRALVVKHFSVEVISPQIARVLRWAVNGR
jgi:glycosyltransferase involved in cell wall biosynthesis